MAQLPIVNYPRITDVRFAQLNEKIDELNDKYDQLIKALTEILEALRNENRVSG